jgi:hypothetical protein
MEISLLRRGASIAMIETYRMRYSHENGITVVLNSTEPNAARQRHVVHLGWNISLHPEDPAGTEYIAWVQQDMAERDERWQIRRNADGSTSSWKLARANDDGEAYDTSDTEAHIRDEE